MASNGNVDRVNLLLAYHYDAKGFTTVAIANRLGISQQTASRLVLLARAIIKYGGTNHG